VRLVSIFGWRLGAGKGVDPGQTSDDWVSLIAFVGMAWAGFEILLKVHPNSEVLGLRG
jgi:hypothetical protein